MHWFDWQAARNEFERILKPDRCLALIWNRFESEPDEYIDYVFHHAKYKRYSHPIVFEETWQQYIGGIRSGADNPSQDEEGYEEFENKLRASFDSRAEKDLIVVEYTTELAIGQLNHRSG